MQFVLFSTLSQQKGKLEKHTRAGGAILHLTVMDVIHKLVTGWTTEMQILTVCAV